MEQKDRLEELRYIINNPEEYEGLAPEVMSDLLNELQELEDTQEHE